ncbi:nucleotidyltransferase family protein [uncultured Clostridium sp.]|uniref:nucleotidyltransferase domain-containing protein n=1 Tax=uncultured Clostridium sp. TaxID=59620 RepID=UPI0026348B1F|nr:nucleotidyltransferase family protein [uncultured Clostridium sp.]
MQEKLLKILSSVVNESKLNDFESLSEKEWNVIYDEASAHSIESVVYYGIKENNIDVKSEKFKCYKKEVALANIYQNRHLEAILLALNKLKESGVVVMVLKGLALRGIYPKSELRSMSDADILVRVEDLDLTCEVLKKLGYKTSTEFSGDEFNIVFDNEKTKIEVHWDLVNDDFFYGKNNFDINVWEESKNLKIKGVECFALGNEDLIVHILMHMMVHLCYMGVGLKQILDLAFMITKNRDEIKWEVVTSKLEEAEILKFSLYAFEVCEKLFDIELPGNVKMLVLTNELDDKNVNLFIEDICSSSILGIEQDRETFGKNFAYDKKSKKQKSVYSQFMRSIFPKADDMSSKYKYLKKAKVLVPFAWTQNIIAGLFHKDYCFSEKRKFIGTIKKAKKRRELLSCLEVK